MKKIEVIIKPFKLEEVKSALDHLGIDGLTVTEVKRFNHGRGVTKLYRGTEYTADFLPQNKLELIVDDEHAELSVLTIAQAARVELNEIAVIPLGPTVTASAVNPAAKAELQYLS